MTRAWIGRRATFACTTFLTGLSAHGAAMAQDRLPAATGSSESAAFQAQGFPAGGFRLYPTLRATVGYDDNVTLAANDEVGDGLVTINPSIQARSQWNRHALNADAFVRVNRYFKREDRNNEEYGAGLNGVLDVARTLQFTGSADYLNAVELRGTPGDVLISDRFVKFERINAAVGVRKQFNRIILSGGVSGTNLRFDDVRSNGVLIDQDFRNRDVRAVNGRVDYQLSPLTSLFVSGSANRVRYNSLPAGGIDRRSDGWSSLAGVRFELSQLLRGEVGVGYLNQSFDDPRFRDFNGLNYSINLRYTPTQLTTVRAFGSRQLTDSSQFQVGGVLASQIGVSAEHELLRNVLVAGDASFTRYKYRGIDRNDDRYSIGIGARYRLSSFVSVAVSADRISQRSDDARARRFDSNRYSLSLVLAR